jgi:hypothetical protein
MDTSALSACQMAARGLGVTTVDPFTFQVASGLGIVARPVRPSIEFSFGFIFHANRSRSALVTAFVDADAFSNSIAPTSQLIDEVHVGSWPIASLTAIQQYTRSWGHS